MKFQPVRKLNSNLKSDRYKQLTRTCQITTIIVLFRCLLAGSPAGADLGYLQVTKDGVLREGPAPYYKISATLEPLTEIQALDKSGEWYLVKTPGEQIGWINAEFVKAINKPKTESDSLASSHPSNNNPIRVELRRPDELVVAAKGFLLADSGNAEKILASLSAGLCVKKLAADGEWYKIELPIGLVGWAHRSLFPEIREKPPVSRPTIVQSILIKNGNLRQNPDRNAAVLATLPVGMTVTLTDSSDNWYKITTDSGQTGWMHRLLFAKNTPPRPVIKTEQRKVLTRNGNLRSTPALNGRVIQVVPARTSVTVLDSIPNWYQVRLSDKTTGWINSLIFR